MACVILSMRRVSAATPISKFLSVFRKLGAGKELHRAAKPREPIPRAPVIGTAILSARPANSIAGLTVPCTEAGDR
jgi:hypothetical protein